MRGLDSELLQGGACYDMPPEVVDKYFLADGQTERFQRMLGKAVCQRCPIQASCLEDAIVVPPGYGVRGGESSDAIWKLHAEWMDKKVDADVLARQAMRRQAHLSGLQTARSLHDGKFNDVPLAFPELGGAA